MMWAVGDADYRHLGHMPGILIGGRKYSFKGTSSEIIILE